MSNTRNVEIVPSDGWVLVANSGTSGYFTMLPNRSEYALYDGTPPEGLYGHQYRKDEIKYTTVGTSLNLYIRCKFERDIITITED